MLALQLKNQFVLYIYCISEAKNSFLLVINQYTFNIFMNSSRTIALF
jgi:hypothetical protein